MAFKEIEGINPYHVFMASVFGGLANMGMMNQASMNIVTKQAAELMFDFMQSKGVMSGVNLEGGFDRPKAQAVLGLINGTLELVGSWEVDVLEDGYFRMRVDSRTCRINPKGVGGGEIKGNVCPIPSFTATLINKFVGFEMVELQERGVEKIGHECHTLYKMNFRP